MIGDMVSAAANSASLAQTVTQTWEATARRISLRLTSLQQSLSPGDDPPSHAVGARCEASNSIFAGWAARSGRSDPWPQFLAAARESDSRGQQKRST